MQHNNLNRYKIGVDIWVSWWYYMRVRCGNDKRKRTGQIRKGKPQKPSNPNLKRKQRGAAVLETGGRKLRKCL